MLLSIPLRLPALLAAAAIAMTLLLGPGGHAHAQPAGPSTIDQKDPTLGSVRGPFNLLFWSEDRGAGHQLFTKRVRGNGFPVGGPSGGEWPATAPTGVGADAGTWGDQRFPATDDSILVWSEKAPGGQDYDLYAQRLHNNGRPSGGPFLLLDRDGDQLHPDIVRADNDYIVVFSEDFTDEGDVMGLRTTNALRPRGEPFPIATGAGVAEDPVITRDLREPRELFTVLFTFTPDGAATKDIYGARVTESGLPRGGPTAIFPVIESDDIDEYAPELLTAFGVLDPRRRSVGGGRGDVNSLLLHTRSDPNGPDGPEVIGQRLRGNGFARGGPFVIAGGAEEQSFPTAILREDNDWLVAWQDAASGDLDISSMRVRFNGIPLRPVRDLAAD